MDITLVRFSFWIIGVFHLIFVHVQHRGNTSSDFGFNLSAGDRNI